MKVIPIPSLVDTFDEAFPMPKYSIEDFKQPLEQELTTRLYTQERRRRRVAKKDTVERESNYASQHLLSPAPWRTKRGI